MQKNYWYDIKNIDCDLHRKENQKKSFFEDNKPFLGFKKITEERKKEIEGTALLWRSFQANTPPPELFYKTLFAIREKRAIRPLDGFSLNYGDESFLFFILAFDPELEILQISLEETSKKEICRRFTERFGFPYDDRLRQIEYYYNKRFPIISDTLNFEK